MTPRALLAAAPLCLGLSAGGCSGRPVTAPAIISERFCYPSDTFVAASWTEPLPAALPGLSERAGRVAVSIGAAPALSELLSGKRVPAARRLRLRQAVLERVVAAQLDVQEAIALLDCEGERGDQLRGVLEAREARRTRRLALASVGFGAATAVLSGGLSLAGAGTASAAAGIAGGSGEASAGAGQVFGATPRGVLDTRRNLLRETRDRPARSVLLPGVVWRYLTRRGAEGSSVLDSVAEQWRGAGLLGEPGTPEAEARAALLYGDGGAYSAEDLLARGAMLDGLEAAIGRMNRLLRLLLTEMEARLAEP